MPLSVTASSNATLHTDRQLTPCPLKCPQGLSHAFHFYTLGSSEIGK